MKASRLLMDKSIVGWLDGWLAVSLAQTDKMTGKRFERINSTLSSKSVFLSYSGLPACARC